jgi:hypothetical protein
MNPIGQWQIACGSIPACQKITAPDGTVYSGIFVRDGAPAEIYPEGNLSRDVADTIPMPVRAELHRRFAALFMAPIDPGPLRAVTRAQVLASMPIAIVSHDAALSWAPEVIADSSGEWCRNSLRFATEREAMASARELMGRWFAVRECRAAPSSDPVTHTMPDPAGAPRRIVAVGTGAVAQSNNGSVTL